MMSSVSRIKCVKKSKISLLTLLNCHKCKQKIYDETISSITKFVAVKSISERENIILCSLA